MYRTTLLALIFSLAAANIMSAREWTDATGTFKVQAELIEMTDTVVKLQRNDNGKVITVPINKLSLADQDHLKSLNAPAADGEWKSYPYAKAGFTVDFPSKPEYLTEKDEDGAITHSYEAGTEDSDVFYSVTIDSLPQEAVDAGAQVILDSVAENFAEVATDKRPIRLDSHPGVALQLEFEEDGVELVILNRIYVIEARLIQIMVVSPAEQKAAAQSDRFFASFKLLKEEAQPIAPPDEADYSGRAFPFKTRSPWPAFLEASGEAVINAEGMFISGDIPTKSGDLLRRDFTFEVVFPLKKGDPIVLIGLGKSHKNASAYMRIHHEYLKSGVGLAKDGQTFGTKGIGGDMPTGTHRAIITKEGNAVTFAIDVDDDGESEKDVEATLPDIRVFQPKFNEDNMHLFIGHGTFREVKLTFNDTE